jgi:acyl-coenzyme A thioesterase 7
MSDVSIKSTVADSMYFVNPGDTNPLGILHGGNLMNWLVSTATLAAASLSKGDALLGALDSVYFLNPIHVGDMVAIRAWVEYVGTSSMEVGIRAKSENPVTGDSRMTTYSHMAFVAVDLRGNPRPVGTKIRPASDEETVYADAFRRWQNRREKIQGRRELRNDISPLSQSSTFKMSFSRLVLSNDALYGDLMYAGRLLKLLDEFTGALATKYAKGIAVTGSVDETVFYYPIHVGDIINLEVALTYVGRSSMEVGAKIVCTDPFTGTSHHAATSFYTFVHIDEKDRPAPVPEYKVSTKEEGLVWEAARARAERRRTEVARLKEMINSGLPLLY